MIRKWSPAAEQARNDMARHLGDSGLAATESWACVNRLCHELAQQIRDRAVTGVNGNNTVRTVAEAADCIDPDV